MRILVVSESFAPGFRGGSILALTHMVDRLGDRCEFWVLTRDRDRGRPDRFRDVAVDRWMSRGPARVFYRARRHSLVGILRAVRDATPDAVFLNSVFARGTRLCLTLSRLGLLDVPVVIAPEGEFCAGALAQRPLRKQAFLAAARGTGLFRGARWIARAPNEVAEIQHVVRDPTPPTLVPCLPPVTAPPSPVAIDKTPDVARLLYLSRITPKKNLRFLLEVLQRVTGRVELSVVGPIDDSVYWAACQREARQLNDQISVRYLGECPPAAVPGHLDEAHALVLPTLGENYGYVIAEALAAGRPVIVSDRTPWQGLEAGSAGWDIPLDRDRWLSVLQRVIALTDDDYAALSAGATARSHQQPIAAEVERATLAALAAVAGGEVRPGRRD